MSVREEDRAAGEVDAGEVDAGEVDAGEVGHRCPAARRAARRPVRWGLVAGGTVVVVAGVAGGLLVFAGDGDAPKASGPATATATVVRTDLSDSTSVDGTLGFADSYTVIAGGHGHLTWLPDEGVTIHRGKRVYAADGVSVPLFYGATPLWRPLRTGVSDGPDVRELERNLSALGYGDDMTVDDTFTAATAAAVRAWQDDREGHRPARSRPATS